MFRKIGVPKKTLSVTDAIALIVGVVIGVGIFKTPSIVAANTGTDSLFLLAWLAGGLISMIGALCYAELATTYPHAGGDYYYLSLAFGRNVAFLFAWARMTVIQPGSIAMLAFVFGDYISQLLPSGTNVPFFLAALAVLIITVLNSMGTQKGTRTQNVLTAVKMVGLFSVVIAGILFTSPTPRPLSTNPTSQVAFGLAMIFVLLTFGGWNEAAYISAELPDVRHKMVRALVWSLGIITAVYLLVSLAYLKGLGLREMSHSEVVAADLMRLVLGQRGAQFVSLLIGISALGAINAAIFTGARTNYALGQDFSFFEFLGRWHERNNTPSNALLLQGGMSLMLVLLGTVTRKGFVTMVDYTAPVFWFFFFLVGLSLIVLRTKKHEVTRPFRVPIYPLTPLVFCGSCIYMLQSSLVYTGVGALVGVAVLLAGMLFLLVARRGDKEREGRRT